MPCPARESRSAVTPAAPAERDPRWAAVLARDPSFDGRFVFSVASTGVYCRPSCAARRAAPRNVRFHDGPAQAEAAGFRPCLRCRPERPGPGHRHAVVVAEACRRIERAEQPPSLAVLAQRAGLSPHHFQRVFTAVAGVSPRDYAAGVRAERLRDGLLGGARVTEAIHAAGFGSNSRFYERGDAMLGMTPTRYRDGGAGEEIRHVHARCCLGVVLVAASARGVCAILLGDDADALLGDLRRRFRRARLFAADAGFEQTLAAVVALVERPRADHGLPLDIRGTVFQQRVWQALAALPPGGTAPYAAIAAAVGRPGAVRAVAGACAANALAVAIPCHRVVRSDGGLSGYRWGVDRKRALLQREAAQAADPAA